MSASADIDTSLPAPLAGRSLWSDAWRRLRANRPAMAGAAFLILMAVACFLGPLLLPHDYNTAFRDYTKVPASLSPYPHADQLKPVVEQALRRARVTAGEVAVGDGGISVTVSSTRPIDPRIGVYLDRTGVFKNGRVTDLAPDKLSATVAADVTQEHFYFGTDVNGRDLLSRTLVAGRVSLTIGLLATIIALVLGVVYGATSGYLGGNVDLLMMRVVDVLYSLPFIFFVILLVVFFGQSIGLMFIAVGCIEWLDMARIVRGQTLSLRRQEFVQAAEAMGVGGPGILRRHIVPNLLGPVIVYVTLLVPKVILLESFLSFLGLGVQEPLTSWGVLISDGARNMQGAWWMLFFPALFLTSTLFALNFLGDGLRDALDPKER